MTNTEVPNPVLTRAESDFDRGWKRYCNDWSDFVYRFTLTESQERYLRDHCASLGFDFDAEWRAFNDVFEPLQSRTPAAQRAEKEWYPRRMDNHYRAFKNWLYTRHLMEDAGLYSPIKE